MSSRTRTSSTSVPACARILGMDAALAAALERARYSYLTPYSAAGRTGPAPTWLHGHHGGVRFTTQPESLRPRRLRKTARLTAHVGRPHGRRFDGRARWVR